MNEYIKRVVSYFLFFIYSSSYQKAKDKLNGSEVSQSILYPAALSWYSFNWFFKSFVWSCCIGIPLVISVVFVAPLAFCFLAIPSSIFLLFLGYEEKLIKNAMANKKPDNIISNLEAAIKDDNKVIQSINASIEKEKVHDLGNLDSWDIEQGGDVLRDAVLKAKPGTRSQTIVNVSKNITQKAEEVLSSLKESSKETENFLQGREQTKKELKDDGIDAPSVWALRSNDMEQGGGKTLNDAPEVSPFSEIPTLFNGLLKDNQSYERAKRIVSSREPAQEEAEFQAMIASLRGV